MSVATAPFAPLTEKAALADLLAWAEAVSANGVSLR
jgi:hypothetical protein